MPPPEFLPANPPPLFCVPKHPSKVPPWVPKKFTPKEDEIQEYRTRMERGFLHIDSPMWHLMYYRVLDPRNNTYSIRQPVLVPTRDVRIAELVLDKVQKGHALNPAMRKNFDDEYSWLGWWYGLDESPRDKPKGHKGEMKPFTEETGLLTHPPDGHFAPLGHPPTGGGRSLWARIKGIFGRG